MRAIDKAYNYIMTCDIKNIGLDGGYPSVGGVSSSTFPTQLGGGLIVRRGSDMFLFPRYISCHMNITHRRLSERLNASQEIYDRLDDIKRILSL